MVEAEVEQVEAVVVVVVVVVVVAVDHRRPTMTSFRCPMKPTLPPVLVLPSGAPKEQAKLRLRLLSQILR